MVTTLHPSSASGHRAAPQLYTPPFKIQSHLNSGYFGSINSTGSMLPAVQFPVFDGSNPKIWQKRCESYFELYDVPCNTWVRLATMHFEGPAIFWLQFVESKIKHMSWDTLAFAVCNRFGRDELSLLNRQFFHIKRIGSVAEYIEQLDNLIHQLLAHDSTMSPSLVTAKFLDGLKEEIKSVVTIQRPQDIDSASSLALLQEDVLINQPRKEWRKPDANSSYSMKLPHKHTTAALPLPPPPKIGEFTNDDKRNSSFRNKRSEDRLASLKSYRRAKGLCFTCGEKWSHTHKCATSIPLHVVEEIWAMMDDADSNVKSMQAW